MIMYLFILKQRIDGFEFNHRDSDIINNIRVVVPLRPNNKPSSQVAGPVLRSPDGCGTGGGVAE